MIDMNSHISIHRLAMYVYIYIFDIYTYAQIHMAVA